MLILTRKPTEDVLLTIYGHTITVRVVETRGNGKVRLGFEGNRDVPVHRCEVWERIHAADRAVAV